ncbi:MAG: helix-turn-helix transcriptional regulator [Coraliomargarita sp.]
MKRTTTGIELHQGKGNWDPACPFHPAQTLEWNDDHGRFLAKCVPIKDGLDYLRISLTIDSPIPVNIQFGEPRLMLGYINSGWAKSEVTTDNVEKLEPGQWFRASADQLCLDRTSEDGAQIDVFLCSPALTQFLLNLDPDDAHASLEQFASRGEPIPFSSGQMNSTAFNASKLIADSEIDGIRHRLQLEGNVLSWMAEVLIQSKSSANSSKRALNADDHDAIDNITQQMHREPGQEYSIDDLCMLGGINEHKLKSAFKSIHGKTAFSYLREVRMDHAASLLKEDRLSVIQVANEVGYSNASHFARAFKDRHGLLPKAYQCIQRLG